jgi:hypothetical protein
MIADVGKAEARGDGDGARAGGKERGLGDAKAAAALKRDSRRIGIIMRVGLVRIVKDRIANRIIKPNGLSIGASASPTHERAKSTIAGASLSTNRPGLRKAGSMCGAFRANRPMSTNHDREVRHQRSIDQIFTETSADPPRYVAVTRASRASAGAGPSMLSSPVSRT